MTWEWHLTRQSHSFLTWSLKGNNRSPTDLSIISELFFYYCNLIEIRSFVGIEMLNIYIHIYSIKTKYIKIKAISMWSY